MPLVAHRRNVETDEGSEGQLFVSCTRRGVPTPLSACVNCEMCEGMALDGVVSVRCKAAPESPRDSGLASRVSQIMSSPVISVDADTAIENVQWLLVSRGIGAVPVIDRAGQPVGILAKTDLLRDRDDIEPTVALGRRVRTDERGSSEETVSGIRAADLMTPVIHAVRRNATIAAAAAVMARERVHHVLVVSDEGGMLGMVSTFDVARWAARSTEGPAKPRM